MHRDALEAHLNKLLDIESFSDYAPTGLQVEGAADIERVVCGVSANQALIEAAVAVGAQALVVHHGFFWRNEPRELVGLRAARVRRLFAADMSLFGYHLPLDAHRLVGNNAGLLEVLGTTGEAVRLLDVGWKADLPEPLPLTALAAKLAADTGRTPICFGSPGKLVRTIGVCSGGAAGYFEDAIDSGVDLYVTGEPSEQSQGLALESGVAFIAAGHHGTERHGPQRLAKYLRETLKLDATFIDVPNPV